MTIDISRSSEYSLLCARIWTFAIVSIALFMVVLDNLVVTNALPSIREDLGATIQSLEWTVNAYTLSYAVLLLTGAALGDRFGRRRMFVARPCPVHRRLRGGGTRAHDRRADRRARRAGRRRRDRDPADPDAAGGRVPGRAARPGDRRLVGHLRPRHRARAAGRRGRRRGDLVALDLLAQRADRAGAAATGSRAADREPRACALARPARRGARQRRPARHRLRDRARRRARLDEHHGAVLADRRRGADGGLPGVGGARAGADAAAALLPLARVQLGQRRVAGDVLRRLRVDLPARAVLPGRPGLLGARGRPADAAVDRDADVRRPDRRACCPTGSAHAR